MGSPDEFDNFFFRKDGQVDRVGWIKDDMFQRDKYNGQTVPFSVRLDGYNTWL